VVITGTASGPRGQRVGFGEVRGRKVAATDFAAGRLLLSTQRAWDKRLLSRSGSESASRSDVRVDGRADEPGRAELSEKNPVARRTQEFFRQSAWTWPPAVLQPRSDRSARANIYWRTCGLGRGEVTGEPALSPQNSSSDSRRCVRPMAERFQLAGGTNWCQPQRRGLAEGRFSRCPTNRASTSRSVRHATTRPAPYLCCTSSTAK
jgi:hypothetical protein